MSISTREATVTLSGVTTVTFDRRYPYFAVRNDSSAPVYISTVNANCTAGAAKGDDGVITIGDGETFNYMHMMGLDTVYITGSGAVAVAAKNEAAANFKAVQKGGGSGMKTGGITLHGQVLPIYAVGEAVDIADTEVIG